MRVVTWNLASRLGERERRLEALLAALRAARPDLVGLQEAWEGAAERIADALGFASASSPSPVRDDGNAVLARWPIAREARTRLQGDDGRTLLHAEIEAPPGRVPFWTTQLSSDPSHSALRTAQVEEIARLVAASPSAAHPAILTGDFNALPESDEIRRLEGHLTAPVVPGLLLVDAWRYAPTTAPGLTWNRENPHVAATHEPSGRIDYVFVGLPRDGRGAVVGTGLVGAAPIDGTWASDHAGVVVDLAA